MIKLTTLAIFIAFIIAMWTTSTTAQQHVAVYKIDPNQCQNSPVCCCAQGTITMFHNLKNKKQVRIKTTLPGGANCGGKSNVDGVFDIVTDTTAIFRDRESPLVVRAELLDHNRVVSFTNNLQQCRSIGFLDGVQTGPAGSTFTTLNNHQQHRQQQVFQHVQQAYQPFF